MRNYFEALGLNRQSSAPELQQAINNLSADQLRDEGDIQSVLQNDQWRSQYRRVHLQYEAIAAAMNNQALESADNTHSWDKRLVEFESVRNTIEG